MQVSAASLAQKITLSKSNLSLKSAFKELKEQSGYNFVYADSLLKDARPVDLQVRDMELKDVLQLIFSAQRLNYLVRDKTVIVKAGNPDLRQDIISGFVGDKKTRQPIPGVTVSIKGTKSVVQTDKNGKFTISVPSGARSLELRYIGYKVTEAPIQANATYTIYMEEEEQSLKETVITGMTNRKAATFTGAAKTVTGTELLQVSRTNVFAAIQALDPAFRITPNNVLGGDINALPDITVRGQGTFQTLGDEIGTNRNLPLFILDKFEVTLQQVADLDMNRIASITILKDASATSMYGARGANGIMVIETIVPPPGKLEISLSNTFTYSMPDLSVYNLLNAREKLNFEERIGIRSTYDEQYLWAERNKQVLRGVDTDWRGVATQNGLNNRTTLGLGGGDEIIRYNLNFSGNLLQGVMKGQDRKNYSGAFTLSYNTKKFNIRNNIIATQTVSNASPYGDFQDYLNMNPYTIAFNADGSPTSYAEDITVSNSQSRTISKIPNPVADTRYNTINDRNSSFTVQNQTSAEIFLTQNLRAAVNFGITKVNGRTDNFLSAFDSSFIEETDPSRKGSYSVANNSSLALDGQARASYNNRIGVHIFTAGANFDVRSNSSDNFLFRTTGFPFDKLDNLLFATQYEANGKPEGNKATVNAIDYGATFNYSYDNRFNVDFSYNRAGSSAYGEKNRFSGFWSTGLSWNLHNEAFLKPITQINSLRIRGSYGSTGSNATDPNSAQFRYNFGTNTSYYGQLGASLAGLANLSLGPQNRIKANAGIDMSLLNSRLSIGFDFYKETTQNAQASVSLAPSSGFDAYTENLGKIQNTGINFDLSYQVLKNTGKGLVWTLSANGAWNKNVLKELSEKMRTFNERLTAGNDNAPVLQYIEGNSMTGIYTVPSMGIDPITGQEIYVKRDGTLTYTWDTNDRVLAGDSNPTLAGTVNSRFTYRGFALGFNIRYEFGGQLYNSTLATRVEGSNPRFNNVDRRAYDLGWKNPGDISLYKRIGPSNTTPRSSSRLLQDNNTISVQGFSLGYQFQNMVVQRMGLKNLSLTLNTNNAINWSSILIERGTSTPFVREYSFNLSTRF